MTTDLGPVRATRKKKTLFQPFPISMEFSGHGERIGWWLSDSISCPSQYQHCDANSDWCDEDRRWYRRSFKTFKGTRSVLQVSMDETGVLKACRVKKYEKRWKMCFGNWSLLFKVCQHPKCGLTPGGGYPKKLNFYKLAVCMYANDGWFVSISLHKAFLLKLVQIFKTELCYF